MGTLFLHVGAGKTGTTAIQRFLACVSPSLARYGFSYPIDEKLRSKQIRNIGSGNGYELAYLIGCPGATKLRGRSCSYNSLHDLSIALARSLEHSSIVLSSEQLQFPDRTLLSELSSSLHACGVNVRIIYYIRHAIDYLVSAYLQNLKLGYPNDLNQAFPRSLDQFIRSRTVPFQQTLEAYLEAFTKDSMHVISFDDVKDDLLASFLKVLGLPSDILASYVTDENVNRSLTPTEMLALEYLSDCGLSSNILRKLGLLLANSVLPETTISQLTHYPVSSESVRLFSSRNAPILGWLGAEFPHLDGKVELEYSPKICVTDSLPDLSLAAVEAFMDTIINRISMS